ncbi:MAG TPA: glutamine synthetase family protein [Thermoleophilia bacterium]|nr:glutamine synthetase family protein [Thermoleophilia bacterium]
MAEKLTKEDVLRIVEDKQIKFVRFWFTDVLGSLKSFAVTPPELEGAFEEGMGFDGSSIEGFARIEESDMVAWPDPDTFRVLPWRAGAGGTARMFCDIRQPNGDPYDGDPRNVLKRVVAKAEALGYTMNVGPELEFFYFKDSCSTQVLDLGGYFDLTTLDAGSDLRRDTINALHALGIEVEYSHHEVAPSQHEIDLRYKDVMCMADQVMTYRLTVKEIAQAHGVYATFMPKPIFGVNGSGMHVHQSLFQGNRNAFFDAGDEYNLSKVGKSYVAGLLAHVKEIALVTNQWVNSYKRLVPGYEAPVYICWSRRNRSAMVRVPLYKPGKENATRVELRNPDPSCNPYLAFAAMLAAGLDGIEKGMELPPEASNNIYEMTAEERAEAGIESLPEDLLQAIEEFEKSSFVREALGDHVCDYLIRNKWAEWDEYKTLVTPYEIDRYLPIL